MSLCIAASAERERPCSPVKCVDCGCDIEKINVIRDYVHGHFPDRAVREFHSRSTVRQGGVAVPCAEHHVLSLSDERPCCVVLTGQFLDQSVGTIDDCLRRWSLANALRVEGVVIVGRNGISPL